MNTSPSIKHAASLALALATILATSPLASAADKGLLGDDLKDLQSAVDSQPVHNKPAQNTNDNPNIPAILIKPPAGEIKKTDIPKIETPGDNRPPVIVKPNDPPITQQLPAGKPNLLPAQWQLEGGADAAFKAGELTLGAKADHGGVTASFHKPLAGDFDVQFEYALLNRAGAEKIPLSGGLGIRLDSTGDWNADQQLTVDRKADNDGDQIAVAVDGEAKPALSAPAKTFAGSLRIQRKGDRIQISCREENIKEWTSLGAADIKLSPKLDLWLTVYSNEGALRATIRHFTLQPAPR
jgi:hypothetical protein